MRICLLLATLLTSLLLAGCTEDKPATAPPQKTDAPTKEVRTVTLFDEAIEPVVVELPSEALPYWRDASRVHNPALVLFSIHPLLDSIPVELAQSVAKLMQSGTPADFREHGSQYRAEPLVLSTQALTAAIDAKLFSEIVWVFPAGNLPEEVQPELFRNQITEAGFFTTTEAEGLRFDDGVFSGTLRGLPFRAVHPQRLPAFEKPLVLHLDLGFFKGLYQGEVKTRLYDILLNTALSLNKTGWAPDLVTLSYSTIEGTFSPDVRFLISNFAELLRDPVLLDGTMPEAWGLRSEALYSANFFLEGKVQEYYEQAAQKYPNDAAAQYDLYKHMFFEQRRVDEALPLLERAVALDPGYVAAYLQLAQIANNDSNLSTALQLLGKAAPLVPENPFIDFYRARFFLESGQNEEAIPLIESLKTKTWSNIYHADVPAVLEQMLNFAKGEPPSQTPALVPNGSNSGAPPNDPARKRILK